ncbi:glycosyl hydrolase 108 family protein [Segetibacter sp.]|jgi:lysozyme family protein|uniref:glycoside hydrolase family 108 protein n=1 Tax=Segetibacter sp. TaxID=2231182 RepID=UPI00261DFD29|nr:glycosyl hydrolase 108 family protein [Segetibacter sp.]MCW3081693.1 hypothetical protein [Segetibacter sp.]
MAIFEQAYQITTGNEGGYANDPHDSGGETWKGVSRKNWPHWQGWPIVDNIKSKHPESLNDSLAKDIELTTLVLNLYKKSFWDCNSLDLIRDQQIANQLFDIGVNMGTGEGAKLLQSAIDTFPGNSIPIDEKVGPKTIETANNLDPEKLYNVINELRKAHYNAIIIHNPSDERYRNTWFSRIKPYNESMSTVA